MNRLVGFWMGLREELQVVSFPACILGLDAIQAYWLLNAVYQYAWHFVGVVPENTVAVEAWAKYCSVCHSFSASHYQLAS
jgi:hypothetical protein